MNYNHSRSSEQSRLSNPGSFSPIPVAGLSDVPGADKMIRASTAQVGTLDVEYLSVTAGTSIARGRCRIHPRNRKFQRTSARGTLTVLSAGERYILAFTAF